jgi:hypothetical protein
MNLLQFCYFHLARGSLVFRQGCLRPLEHLIIKVGATHVGGLANVPLVDLDRSYFRLVPVLGHCRIRKLPVMLCSSLLCI